MRIADAQWIPSTPHQTWDALLDPQVLRQCLPGCVEVTRLGPAEYALTLRTKMGGMEHDYQGEVLLSDVEPGRSAMLAFEGMGAAAGLVIGTAQLTLAEKENGTRLSYAIAGMAGGKLAELGEAVILKAGNKILDKFFAAFVEHMSRQPHTAPPPPPPEPEATGISNSPWSWALAIVVVVALVGFHMWNR